MQPRRHPGTGRLVAAGRLSEILAFELKGWELVVAHLSDPLRASLQPRARALTPLAHGRYTIDLPPEVAPDAVLSELAAGGAHQVISLNPCARRSRTTFVQSVSAASARQTGL